MGFIFIAPSKNVDLEGLNQLTREWTRKAARGECDWICSDCGTSFKGGMPDECPHGDARCTDIIKRDKLDALNSGGGE